jgi:hypothetical protein
MLRIIIVFLSLCCIESFASEPYDRVKQFGGWIDVDHNCRDTRQEVLISQSLIPVVYADEKKCKVLTGLWICPYTGRIMTNVEDIDIDHMVPLGEAYVSGADTWPQLRRKQYANYLNNPNHLIAVYKAANRSKNNSDPRIWMPPNIAYWKTYLDNWVTIKKQWGLSIDTQEQFMIDANYKTYEMYNKGVLIQPPINACMIR